MNTVRIGIIGMGNIGKHHAEYLLNHEVARCELTAVCSPNPAELERYKPLEIFSDAQHMIESGAVDAVIIATPHFQHTALGMAALSAGVHAIVEKPISAHKADAERLIAAHRQHPQSVFAGMFQLRVEPRYLKIRSLIDQGQLGELTRITWINTDWYRTEAYYASGAWRATWQGEGGGVLLNQCLHHLDILQWLCGMPARVRGFCQLGRFHHIEVEDNISAYMEWPQHSPIGGACGSFISSTGEAPGTNRLEIVGTLGKLVLENDRLAFTRNQQDMFEFSKTAEQAFSKPASNTCDIPFENATRPHATIVQNFVNAILDGEPLLVPGEDGLNSVELANAILFSSMLDKPIDMPMDGSAWERKLEQLIADSTMTKRGAEKHADHSANDFVSSFRR